MSIDVGVTIGNVFLGEDGPMSQSQESLQEILGALPQNDEMITGMRTALERILDGTEDPESMFKRGRFLLGIVAPDSTRDLGLDGLLYAEGQRQKENEAFGRLDISMWVDPNRSVEWYSNENLRNDFLTRALREVEPLDGTVRHSGIPVDRDTFVVLKNSVANDVSSFHIGERNDEKAVAELLVPDDLKILLTDLTLAYHAAERARYAEQAPDTFKVSFN